MHHVARPTLTDDERKAAEAAFRGLPLNPAWPRKARAIYSGIVEAAEGRKVVDGAPSTPDRLSDVSLARC